jgi:hypothetical protein
MGKADIFSEASEIRRRETRRGSGDSRWCRGGAKKRGKPVVADEGFIQPEPREGEAGPRRVAERPI